MDLLEPYRDLRQSRDSEFLIAEGTWVVDALLGSEFETVSVILRDTLAEPPYVAEGIPVVRLSKKEINELVGFDFHHSVLACARRPEPVRWLEEFESFSSLPTATFAVCPSLADASNLGAIIRSAAALGISAVLVPVCAGADPFCRKAIRASSGTAFRIPVLECRELLADMAEMKRSHVVIGSSLRTSAMSPRDFQDKEKKKFILLGSEGGGLDDEWEKLCTDLVRIPMAAGVESLNVSAAAAILFHSMGSMDET